MASTYAYGLVEVYSALLSNKGHCLRLMGGRTAEALSCFRAASSKTPTNASLHTCVGYCHHLEGDLVAAIESYHKSLSLAPEDSVTSGLLDLATNEAALEFV